MTTNTAMTHYSRSIVNHAETWSKTTYNAVMWQVRKVVNPSTGFVENNEVRVYIPELTYNFKQEDIIVKGICEDETPVNIKDKFTITAVIPCDYGSLQHTELIGQ